MLLLKGGQITVSAGHEAREIKEVGVNHGGE
jgi:hypothetical protein